MLLHATAAKPASRAPQAVEALQRAPQWYCETPVAEIAPSWCSQPEASMAKPVFEIDPLFGQRGP